MGDSAKLAACTPLPASAPTYERQSPPSNLGRFCDSGQGQAVSATLCPPRVDAKTPRAFLRAPSAARRPSMSLGRPAGRRAARAQSPPPAHWLFTSQRSEMGDGQLRQQNLPAEPRRTGSLNNPEINGYCSNPLCSVATVKCYISYTTSGKPLDRLATVSPSVKWR